MHWHNQKYQIHVITNIHVDCICFILSPKVLIYGEVENLLVIGIKITDVSKYLGSGTSLVAQWLRIHLPM